MSKKKSLIKCPPFSIPWESIAPGLYTRKRLRKNWEVSKIIILLKYFSINFFKKKCLIKIYRKKKKNILSQQFL